MFHVLTITYLESADVVEAARPAHVEWVKAEVDAGRVILAGRLEAARGGILVTSDLSAEEVDCMIGDDPYLLAGVARYDRTSFTATLRAPGI